MSNPLNQRPLRSRPPLLCLCLILPAIALLGSSCAPQAGIELDSFSSRAWKESKTRIEEVLGLESRKPALPEKAWFRFDQREADKQIDALLDEVIEVLEVSALTDWRNAYRALEHQIQDAELKIAEFREHEIYAPGSSSFNPFTTTKKDYEDKIDALRRTIEQAETEKLVIIERLRDEYAKIGVNLSRDQVQFYLSSISGRDIVTLSSVFHNIKQLNLKLEEILRESPDNTGISKRYYGIHVVLLKTLIRSHALVLERIEQRYLPRIADLTQQNKSLSKETLQLMNDGNDQEKPILTASLEAQKVTAQALELYRDHLQNLKTHVTRGSQALSRRYQVANNAYQTVKVAAALVTEMEACMADLAALQEMHLPDLLPIENELLERKFSEITARIDF